MKQGKLQIEKEFRIAKTDPRLFSSFLEHLGRAVYTGIYEPGHSTADENGFRTDVMHLVQELGVSYVRYPGGNFLSGYDWTDGIGPRESRPRRLDLAWHTIESNQFGLDEFYDWSQKAGTSIMGAVNMGTGTPKQAAQILEYANYPGGTYWSDLRRKNGHEKPLDIKLWCIGNEMDGDWQICHLDAQDYGKKALETAKMMKGVDDSIEVIACGSASVLQPTYPEWDRVVLEHTYEKIDYLSLHRYYENEGNQEDFLASFVDMNDFIHTIAGTCDYVKALKRSRKKIFLSFDEWNVWYQANQRPHPWQEAPQLIEDHYTLLDALVFAGLGMTLLNNSDRVKIACLAQLVNVIAPILTQAGGRAIKQTIYYPFQLLSQFGRGTVLRSVAVSDRHETKYGDTPYLYPCVVSNEETNELTVFCLNIAAEELELSLEMPSFGAMIMRRHVVLSGKDLKLQNTFEHPNAVCPQEAPLQGEAAEKFKLILPAHSFHMFRFQPKA